ncbi:MAG: prepilin-type N-terminal cleavage/methylation domain-containing protein [Candidatus Omnitrophota bacterium]
MNGSQKNKAGFTIIELMIALLVLTLMIGSYVGANVKAQQNTEEMNERTVALQDANRVIERMRDTSNAESLSFPSGTVAVYPNDGTIEGFNNLTDEVVTVSYADESANPLDVTVTVTWTSYTGREHTETVKTHITQR